MLRMIQGNRNQEHKGYQGARQGRPYPIRKTTARRMVRAPLAGALVPIALDSIPAPPANALDSFVLLPFALIPVAPMGKTTARRMVRAPLAGALVALVALLPIALLPIAQDPIPSTWRLACPRAMHPSRS